MQEATQAKSTELRFNGLDFTNQRVACPHCSWEGSAGQLLAPVSRHAGTGIAYACPECHQPVARHAGFSGEDIRREMREIRRLISEVRALRAIV